MGYAFAQVTPRGDRNFENHTISVVYAIDQGPRTYVERIEIRGNARTRDFVVRREFDVSEGDAFNQVLGPARQAPPRERSISSTTVEISTAPGSRARPGHSGGRPGREIDRRVLDRRAAIRPAARRPDRHVEGVDHRAQLPRSRPVHPLLGGWRQEFARDFMLSFTEPYFLGRRIAAGLRHLSARRAPTTTTRAIRPARTIRFGLPITEALSTQLAYNLSQEEYEYRRRLPRRTAFFDPSKCDVSHRDRKASRTVRGSSRRSSGSADLQHDRRHEESAFGLSMRTLHD